MPTLTSRIRTSSSQFASQRAEMMALIDGFRSLEARVREASNAKRARFHKHERLLPRERVAALLDPGTPWIELSTLAGLGMHDDDGERDVLGGGSILGIGYVSGARCLVNASDAAIKGGTISPMGLKKTLRGQQIAMENKLPVISLIESGGANLNYQAELFVDGGRAFYNQSRMSAMGIPQITVVHGSSTAGGAYIPGLSDYVVMVRDRAKVFLAGPPLLLAATGEVAGDEELGGAQMHASISGVAEYIAPSDADALRTAREIMAKIGWATDATARSEARPPRYDPDELCGVVPTDYRTPYDVREVLARVVDDSDFLDFKQGYGSLTVCGHAHVGGMPCGLIGNNGPIDFEGASKAAQFIQLCSQSGTPLVFLQNTTGFLVGRAQEQAGIIKHGAKMIQAVSNATVPRITLHLGASFGAGNYGMCGRAYDPRFVFSWPNTRIAVMGGPQAATVMEIVLSQKMDRAGQGAPDPDFMRALREGIEQRMDEESSALFATARLWDDGLIDPRDTRHVLTHALDVCRASEARALRPNTFGVARM